MKALLFFLLLLAPVCAFGQAEGQAEEIVWTPLVHTYNGIGSRTVYAPGSNASVDSAWAILLSTHVLGSSDAFTAEKLTASDAAHLANGPYIDRVPYQATDSAVWAARLASGTREPSMWATVTYDTIYGNNHAVYLTALASASPSGTLVTTFSQQPRGSSVAPICLNSAGSFVDTPLYLIIGYEAGVRDTQWLQDVVNSAVSGPDTGYGSSVTSDAGTYDSIVSIQVYGNAADSVQFQAGAWVWLGQTLSADPAVQEVRYVGHYGFGPDQQSIYNFPPSLGRGLHYSCSDWRAQPAHGSCFPIKFYYTTQ